MELKTQNSKLGTRNSGSNVFSDVLVDVLSIGHRVCFRASGRSMNPTIREGERITVEPVASSDVRVGDIVLYRTHRAVLAHRVMTIESRDSAGHIFVLRGDASSTCDESAESGQILGRVVSVEREGRCVDLSSRRAKMAHKLRVCASRLKQCVRRGFDKYAKVGNLNQ